MLIGGGLAASAVFISKAARSLHGSPLFHTSTSSITDTTPVARPPAHPHARRRRSGSHHLSVRRPAARHRARQRSAPRTRPARNQHHAGGLLHLGWVKLVLVVALEIAAGLLLLGALLLALVVRRLRLRSRREYALYELHLSMHDQAKPQDLEDMVEAIANIVRAFPAERARSGQPYVALELVCGEGQHGMEWSINVRCQPSAAQALDAAISAAYPDVRLGRRHADAPLPRAGSLQVPGVRDALSQGAQLRLPAARRRRGARLAAARADRPRPGRARAPSIVRFQLTPTPSFFEEYARRLYKRHENKLVRQERWGLPEGGLWSTLNRAEMSNAQRTQNRSLFWLEAIVAADTMQSCKTVAAAVQSRRGENRLHRRWMIVRQNLYRRRFPHALGPLLPSTRNLVSAAEVAHLLALPTARMKGVPVRRLTLPRIPLPPEVIRAHRPRSAHPTGTPPERHASRRAQAHPPQSPTVRKAKL